MVSSGSLHIRLLHWQCAPQDTELFLGDFKQPGFNKRLGASLDGRRYEEDTSVYSRAGPSARWPAGCDQEQRAVGDANPVRAAEMQQTYRDLWIGHIYWMQLVVLYNATNNPAERDAQRTMS
jgi:hypothetical protein